MISNIEESKDISFKAEGYSCVICLDGLSEEELKNLKELILKLLGDVLVKREQLYECIRRINGELDRRTNEKACKE